MMNSQGGGDSTFSGPVQVSASSGFAWAQATSRKEDVTSMISDGSRSQFSALDPSFAKASYGIPKPGNQVQDQVLLHRVCSKHETTRKQLRTLSHHQPESFDASDFVYQSPEISQMGVLAKSMVIYSSNHFVIFALSLLSMRIIGVKNPFCVTF